MGRGDVGSEVHCRLKCGVKVRASPASSCSLEINPNPRYLGIPCLTSPYLSAQLDLYYNGFCNTVLWQLFHYVPLNIDSWQKMAEHRAMQMQWQAYQVQ